MWWDCRIPLRAHFAAVYFYLSQIDYDCLNAILNFASLFEKMNKIWLNILVFINLSNLANCLRIPWIHGINNGFVSGFDVPSLQLEGGGDEAGFRGPNVRDEFNGFGDFKLLQATLDGMFLDLGEGKFLDGRVRANLVQRSAQFD